MKRFICALRKRSRAQGQSMVEFGIIATGFLLFVFSMINVSSAVYYYNELSSACREASRYAIVHSPSSPSPATSAQIRQIVLSYAIDMNPDNVTVNSSWPADSNLPTRKDAKVQVTYKYQLSIPFLSRVTFNFTSTSQVLVSQ